MNSSKPSGIIFTDFDGTLFGSDRSIADENYDALEEAAERGFLRVIATGRNLFSFRRVASSLDRNLENYIDYLIFSSGAGTLRLGGGTLSPGAETGDSLIEAESLDFDPAFDASGLFFRHGIDFMIHAEVPENHRFTSIKSNGGVNPDYYRRINIYPEFASPLKPADDESDLDAIENACRNGVSQLVGIIPPSGTGDGGDFSMKLLDYFRARLSGCTVIRTTSPIDHSSLWIEIFNQNVSKSKAASRLAEKFGLTAKDCLAAGNDFNDEDLLEWAGTARTVDGAPEPLKGKFEPAGPAEKGAVAAAVRDFLPR